MEKLSFLIGLVALAVSIYAPAEQFPITATVLFWVAIVMIVIGAIALLRSYVNFTPILELVRGRLPLGFVMEGIRVRSHADEAALIKQATDLARSGRITLFGERGSSRELEKIPAPYFASHQIQWVSPDNAANTYDPNKSFGEQDSDDQYFNLHVERRSIARKLAA
jgi:hypothetical protein